MALSGGRWQRLALARTFLRSKADLLLLDEPTSGLDAAAEYRLQQTLAEYAAGRTRLLISHRLNTLRYADQIAVLADGQIVEQGTHDELMILEGHYAELFEMQAGGYQDARVASQTASSRL